VNGFSRLHVVIWLDTGSTDHKEFAVPDSYFSVSTARPRSRQQQRRRPLHSQTSPAYSSALRARRTTLRHLHIPPSLEMPLRKTHGRPDTSRSAAVRGLYQPTPSRTPPPTTQQSVLPTPPTTPHGRLSRSDDDWIDFSAEDLESIADAEASEAALREDEELQCAIALSHSQAAQAAEIARRIAEEEEVRRRGGSGDSQGC
jgi:hypothetical protein